MKKKLTTVLLVVLLLMGLAIVLYPTVSDYYNSFHQSRAIANYAEAVAEIDTETYQALWNAAAEYNRGLLGRENPFYLTEEETLAYRQVLDYSGNGIMGYISIPKISCELPIYHGTEEAVLQIAIGHIEGSSLPVGGESTHCVLSGHRGLPSAKLFTNLDQLEVGDVFLLRVLDETLTYEVDQIHIVLPTEMQDLYIEKGQDYCTLVTCTPYGVNSHRLLVRGHRIANTEEAVALRVTADAMRIEPLLVAPVAAVPMLLALLLWLLTSSGKPKNRKRRPSGTGKRREKSEPERRDHP